MKSSIKWILFFVMALSARMKETSLEERHFSRFTEMRGAAYSDSLVEEGQNTSLCSEFLVSNVERILQYWLRALIRI